MRKYLKMLLTVLTLTVALPVVYWLIVPDEKPKPAGLHDPGFGPIPVEKAKAYSPEETGTKNPESFSRGFGHRRMRHGEDWHWQRSGPRRFSTRGVGDGDSGNGCGK